MSFPFFILINSEIRQGSDFEYLLTPADVSGVKTIIIEKGLGAVNGITSRDFDDIVENLLRPLQRSGTIGNGIENCVNSGFDDRKVRLHDYRIEEHSLILQLGPTWYQQWKNDCERLTSPEAVDSIKKAGATVHSDQFAYFARPLGVAIVPITLEGHAYIGLREKVDCSGVLSFPSGWLSFQEDISRLHIWSDIADISTGEDIIRELGEYGLTQNNVLSTRLGGLAAHPLRMDGDLVFLTQTNVPDSYFESDKWKEKRTEQEHSRLFKLANPEEVFRLAKFGLIGNEYFEILYSSRLGLEALYQEMNQSSKP